MCPATNNPSLRLASAEVRFIVQLVSRRTMGEATPNCKVAAAMSSTNTVLVEVQQVESMVFAV